MLDAAGVFTCCGGFPRFLRVLQYAVLLDSVKKDIDRVRVRPIAASAFSLLRLPILARLKCFIAEQLTPTLAMPMLATTMQCSSKISERTLIKLKRCAP